MQCACPTCGILMSHRIHGLESECCCPVCGFVCRACMGTNSILSKEMLQKMAVQLNDDDMQHIYQEIRDDDK